MDDFEKIVNSLKSALKGFGELEDRVDRLTHDTRSVWLFFGFFVFGSVFGVCLCLLVVGLRDGGVRQANTQSVQFLDDRKGATVPNAYTVRELAELEGVNEDTIRRRIRSGSPMYQNFVRDESGRYLFPEKWIHDTRRVGE